MSKPVTKEEYDAILRSGNFTPENMAKIRAYRPPNWGPANSHSMRYAGDTWPDKGKDRIVNNS